MGFYIRDNKTSLPPKKTKKDTGRMCINVKNFSVYLNVTYMSSRQTGKVNLYITIGKGYNPL